MELKTQLKTGSGMMNKNLFKNKTADPLLILAAMFALAFLLYYFFPSPLIK